MPDSETSRTKDSGTAESIPFEVLPPGKSGGSDDDVVMRIVALVMDNLFVIPGTSIRFGLDPIIGMFPGLGDSSSNLISAVALLQAAKKGLPRIVLARMALNIIINSLFGAVPVIGDAFSIWWKSNQRNYELLKKHAGTALKLSTGGDWLFVGGLLGGLVCLVIVIAATAAYISFRMLQLIFS